MSKRIGVILWYWTPAILWMILIFFFSSIPAGGPPIFDIPNIDKFFHFVEYFILGTLLFRAFSNSAARPNYLKILIVSILIASIFGATDEFHQRFTRGRSCNIFDLLFDVAGSSIGVFLYLYKERIKHAADKTV